jgi:hypothetical protein
MGIIEDFNSLVSDIHRDESLSGMLKIIVQDQLKPKSTPKNYYYLTEVTNPTLTYYSRLNPQITTPPELGRKLVLGSHLHSIAGNWFRNLPDYIVDEGTLDGAWEDVAGVRGRIDHLIGDSIMEFKTKDNNPQGPEDVIKYYPQDLEQLVFYCAIHPSKPKKNYLVFMENKSPYKIIAFQINIKNIDKIKEVLKSRIKQLNDAIDHRDLSSLGRCRYSDMECKFEKLGLCYCSKMEPLDINAIISSIEINIDNDFTTQLETVRDEHKSSNVCCLSTLDIISPRKHYVKNVLGFEDSYSSDVSSDEYKACLSHSIRLLKTKYNIKLTSEEVRTIKQSQKDQRINIGFRWLKIKKSGAENDIIVPYLVKVSGVSNIYNTRQPSSYSLAELGIACGTYGFNTGLIFTVYPKLDDLVRVYNVNYKSERELFRLVRTIADGIEKAKKDQNIVSLPKCPSFMCDNKTCPLTQECNSAPP